MDSAQKKLSPSEVVNKIACEQLRSDIPDFGPGDSLKVHSKIVEGTKERIQVFQGVVIRRSKGNSPRSTFTVRKISYNIGVERTFLVNSPQIAKIEVLTKGSVRRARLYYLRPLRGKATRIKSTIEGSSGAAAAPAPAEASTNVASQPEAVASESSQTTE